MEQNSITFLAIGQAGSFKGYWLARLKRLLEDEGDYEVTKPDESSDSGQNGTLPCYFIVARKKVSSEPR